MEDLFKIEKIDGKGLGWIALRDIKAGTLICKEKSSFVTNFPSPRIPWEEQGIPFSHLFPMVMDAFFAMSKNARKEFLELHNAYLDLNSFPNDVKKRFLNLKQQIQCQNQYDHDLLLKIIGIYQTNMFENCIGVKTSRINHSCCGNTYIYVQRIDPEKMTNEMETRATSKIR